MRSSATRSSLFAPSAKPERNDSEIRRLGSGICPSRYSPARSCRNAAYDKLSGAELTGMKLFFSVIIHKRSGRIAQTFLFIRLGICELLASHCLASPATNRSLHTVPQNVSTSRLCPINKIIMCSMATIVRLPAFVRSR